MSNSAYNYQPIIIIGAARSGTKILRDIIASHPQVDKVPYDVNYLWRLGNEDTAHDELPVEHFSSKIQKRIVKHISRFSSGSEYLIEKTVSNCLRIPFVYHVFPNAFFIHLVRDGRDVVESSYRQWIAPPDLSYIANKALSFPLGDAFGYAATYATKIISRLTKPNEKTHGTWGPRYDGIDEDVMTKTLIEVCALQWTHCVEKALADLTLIPKEKVITIRYEDFVHDPSRVLLLVAEAIGFEPQPYHTDKPLLETISPQNIGKGVQKLTQAQSELIEPHIRPMLETLGYPSGHT